MAQLVVSFAQKQLSLRYKGVNLLDGIPSATKASYLETANVLLERDLDQCVERIKYLDDGHFLWICTWQAIRLDDLEGMIAWYYVTILIENLAKDFQISSVFLSDHFPSYFREYITVETGIPTTKLRKPISSWKTRLRNTISPLRILYNVYRNRNADVKIEKGDIWLGTDANFELHRYRSFLNHLLKYQKAFFHNFHTVNIMNRMEGDKNLNFSPFFKIADIGVIIKRTFILRRKVKGIQGPYLVTEFFKHINFSQLSMMMLRDTLIDRAMTIHPPAAVFLTTANTYPPARMVTRQTNLHGIPSIVVACRPMFTDLRPEERACTSDLIAAHDAKIADYFVVWDLFSKNTLIGRNIPHDRIFVHQEKISGKSYKRFTLESTFLVLFSDRDLNERLITLLERMNSMVNFTIAIKTHPAIKLNQNQTERLTRLFPDLVDVSAFKMHEIAFKNVVAICINSSAGVDACSNGCGILWLPYLNERAVVFYSVMRVLGWNFSNQNGFLEALKNLLTNTSVRKDFINDCQKSYHKYFVTTDNVQNLLPLLKL